MRLLTSVIIAFTVLVSIHCSEKIEPNRVDLDQIDVDNSNDYRYIFREEIEKEEWQKKRYKKDDF